VEGIVAQAVGALVLLGISAASYKFHATDAWGSVSGFCLGLVIGLTSGWAWVAALIAFLFLGSAVTRYRYQFKLSIHAAEEKHGARGFRNVLANGAVPAAVSVLNFLRPAPVWSLLFVTALASAAADTFATEIGLLSSRRPVFINRPSSVAPPGISGGVTPLGEGAAFAGSMLMVALAAALGVIPVDPLYLATATLAGFAGCNVDSLLGGTIQVLYSCKVCDALTEKKVHCGQPTVKVKGVGFVGNNEVNLISDAVAVLLSALVAMA